MMREGEAFVAPMEGLFGRELLKWDFGYLRRHLPSEERYGVMLAEESGKVVMSHTARNGERQVEGAGQRRAAASQPAEFEASDQSRMTFEEFLGDVRAGQISRDVVDRGPSKMPYFGIHLLWRVKPTDNGFLGKIDEDMKDDLFSVRFDLIKDLQEANALPLVQRFYLFAGVGGTLYHCHYDLQPNIHVQLTGRKRFVLFPPDDFSSLYPFPVHHDLDRRSMVDLDTPDHSKFPCWRGARGTVVELGPGDALYIPPFWWHHVQSLTAETTSMALWFFESFPLSEGVSFGVGPRARDLVLQRDVEELIGRHFPDADGEGDSSRPRPVKAAQVASFVQWMLPRVGAAEKADPSEGRAEALGELTVRPEDLEALVIEVVSERLAEDDDGRGDGGGGNWPTHGEKAQALARRRLLHLWAGRF